ncbi:MAG: hypothetical protein ABI461_20685 [Polyangiaceae bacterium]
MNFQRCLVLIDAPAASKKTCSPKTITLNGKVVTSFVHHADLASATLHFDMTP